MKEPVDYPCRVPPRSGLVGVQHGLVIFFPRSNTPDSTCEVLDSKPSVTWNCVVYKCVRVVHLPSRLGLANLQDSLYVEYCGWEYGLPENSPPVVRKTEEYHEDFTVGTRDRFLDECTSWECVKLHDYRTSASVNLRWFFSSVASLVSSLSFCLSRELSPFTDCHKLSFSLASSLHLRLCRFCLAAFVPPLPTACQPPAEREQERDRKRGVKAIHRGIK